MYRKRNEVKRLFRRLKGPFSCSSKPAIVLKGLEIFDLDIPIAGMRKEAPAVIGEREGLPRLRFGGFGGYGPLSGAEGL